MGIEADLLTLSRSPEFKVKIYKSFDIQDFKFHTKSSKEANCTQELLLWRRRQATQVCMILTQEKELLLIKG